MESILKEEIPANIDRPTPANPLVFHVFGYIDNPYSMVLTEKDYVDFAIYLSKHGERDTLPHSIRQNLPNSTLLFIGHRFESMTFLIFFESFIKLLSSFESEGFAVLPTASPNIEYEKKGIIQKYLDQFTASYFKIRIYWGDLDAFLEELRGRLNAMKK